MKCKNTILTFSLFFLFSIRLISQQITFEYLLNTEKDKYIFDIIECENQDIYFVGRECQPYSNKWDGLITKISASGQYLDSVRISNYLSSYSIVNILPYSTNHFTLSMAMSDTTPNHNHYSILLYKMDTNLTLQEHKQYDFPENYTYFIQILRKGLNNHLLITGTIKPPQGPHKMYLYLLNSNFDSLKAKIYLNEPSIFSYDIKELSNGNFWVLRGLNSHYAYIDSDLNMISAEEGVIPHIMGASFGLKWDTDTSFYLAADYFAGNKTGKKYISKDTQATINLANNSNLKFTDHDIGFIRQYHPFDTSGYIFNTTGAKDTFDFPASWGALDYKSKDSIFIGGTKGVSWVHPNYGLNSSWYSLIQTDSMLNIRWERFYGGDAYYFLKKIIATQDGGCIMAGTRYDYLAHPDLQKRDIYILKVNRQGLLTSTGGKPSPIVHDAIVYPNPGSNLLHIRVAVQYKRSLFRLFDMNGKPVLQKEIIGKNAVIETAFLPKGTYLYTITGKNGLHESGKWVKE